MVYVVKQQREDIFSSNCQTITNTCNIFGVMGKGLAFDFRQKYPLMFEEYKNLCSQRLFETGKPYISKLYKPWILNFPTKKHWRDKSDIEDIENGLIYLDKHHQEWGITSLAMPMLGCNLGGLNKEMVLPLLKDHFNNWSILVEIYY